MDCLTAQGLISDALDRAPIDGTALAEAKRHCQECSTCSVFVRTLLLAKNTPLPQPPADLADRVMVNIRAEALLARQRAQAAEAQAEAASQVEGAPEDAGSTIGTTAENAPATPASGATGAVGATVASLRRWTGSLSRQEMLMWTSAAAIFVAAVAFGATAGIRLLTTGPTSVADKTVASDAATFGSQQQLPAPPVAESASASVGAAGPASAQSVITVTGIVFSLSGPSTIATESLRPAGSTISALGGGSGAASRAVFSGDDPDRVYLADDANKRLLVFDRVVRTYNGRIYQLTSAEVVDFGQWPTLPAQVPVPTAPDGSPTFIVLGADASGTQVYRLASGSPDDGIGIGPGSGSSDPAGGNPNWTWWTPVK